MADLFRVSETGSANILIISGGNVESAKRRYIDETGADPADLKVSHFCFDECEAWELASFVQSGVVSL